LIDCVQLGEPLDLFIETPRSLVAFLLSHAERVGIFDGKNLRSAAPAPVGEPVGRLHPNLDLVTRILHHPGIKASYRECGVLILGDEILQDLPSRLRQAAWPAAWVTGLASLEWTPDRHAVDAFPR
jgi:hypothetical protein